ncbi:MAG: lamin tail domain-containing protein [Candidatus Aenigmarchaeota archaeon]|nr:lamin tail domain-containing protein [Candidatus Aenigmarchaeota archaeon]
MKIIVLLGIILFCAGFAYGQLVIEQVYANPKGSESGGEAVLLRNTGSEPVLMENWTLATQASLRDIVFPAVIVGPEQHFLIADAGWSEMRDDSLWRDADLEQTMTLGNENGGVALIDVAGNIIDAVGWGSAEDMRYPLYKGVPVFAAPERKVLLRTENTGNNVEDFIVADPDFESSDIILLVVTVVNKTITILNVSVLPDESLMDGVQISPPVSGTKVITVRAVIDGSLEGFPEDGVSAQLVNQTIYLERLNDDVYEGVFVVDVIFPAGNHTIKLTAGDMVYNATFEYLPHKKVNIAKKQLSLSSVAGKRTVGEVVLENQGNARLILQAILVGNNSLSEVKVSLDGMVFRSLQDISVALGAGESRKVFVAVEVPRQMRSGTYKTRLKFKEIIT